MPIRRIIEATRSRPIAKPSPRNRGQSVGCQLNNAKSEHLMNGRL